MGEILDKYQEAKAWYKSKTIIGVIIAALGAVITAFFPEWGINLTEKVAAVEGELDAIAQSADVTFGNILSLWGLLQAAYGRVVAKGPVTTQ